MPYKDPVVATQKARERYLKNHAERRASQSEYYQKNKDKIKEIVNKWVQENKEHVKEKQKIYRESHKEEFKEYKKKYYEENKEKCIERSAIWNMQHRDIHRGHINTYRKETDRGRIQRKSDRNAYRSSRKSALPKWQRREELSNLYKMCAMLPNMEVDHIIPLRSKYICGLHITSNLQVIPKEINRRKTNSFIPYSLDKNGNMKTLSEEQLKIIDDSFTKINID